MKEIRGLDIEQRNKYRHAIECGYFDTFEEDPREWRHTFAGSFIWKYPGRVKYLQVLSSIVGHTPEWEDITDDLTADFAEEVGQMIAASSARTICSELKALLNANKRKIPAQDFMATLTLKGEASQHVYLTRGEMERFIKYKPRTQAERFVHKNFCIQMMTGARLMDAQRMTIHNCDINTNMLSYVPQKTPGTIVHVPVDERLGLRKILSIKDVRPCCASVFNDFVRDICKKMGFYEECAIKKAGKDIIAPKWELVSSHTARRSFATNLFLAGASLEDIASMMGHGTNIETTKRYICAEREISPAVLSYFLPENFDVCNT